MSKDNGGPAFPFVVEDGTGSYTHYTGLTLRDYFAAKALQGMWANGNIRGSGEELVHWAYAAADAMLAERAK